MLQSDCSIVSSHSWQLPAAFTFSLSVQCLCSLLLSRHVASSMKMSRYQKHLVLFGRLRWTAGNAQMLCYLKPFADTRLCLVGRISYTMANYGWCLGMLLWALVSYVMIGWIVFQVCL